MTLSRRLAAPLKKVHPAGKIRVATSNFIRPRVGWSHLGGHGESDRGLRLFELCYTRQILLGNAMGENA